MPGFRAWFVRHVLIRRMSPAARQTHYAHPFGYHQPLIAPVAHPPGGVGQDRLRIVPVMGVFSAAQGAHARLGNPIHCFSFRKLYKPSLTTRNMPSAYSAMESSSKPKPVLMNPGVS